MLAIQNGKIFTVTNGTLERGTVLVENGRIAEVGQNLDIPQGAQVIDAAGKWVTPGLIDAHSHISTWSEPQMIPEINDDNEVSDPITPQLRCAESMNPFDMSIPIVRSAGFTTCYTGPGSANVIGGTGFSFKLRDGKTVDDMILPGTEMMKMALGENPKNCYGRNGKMPVTRMGTAALLRETLYKAREYARALEEAKSDPKKKRPEYDARLEALVPVVTGAMKVRIHCHRADDIVTAIRISQEFGLDYSLEHVTEGYLIASYLAQKDPDMVVGPLAMGPEKMEIWNASLSNPARLEAAGCRRFCLMQDAPSGTKYLPTYIGLAIARGLSFDMALRAVTINAASLLKLEHRVGSIEAGKDADLAIWNGNPFCNLSLCEKTVIDGVVYENQPF